MNEFDKALKIKRDYANGYFNKGLIYRLLKGEDNLLLAIKNFDWTIKYNKNFSQAYYEKGLCQLELKNYANAVDSFNKCKELSPEDAERCDSKIDICNNEINKIIANEEKRNKN